MAYYLKQSKKYNKKKNDKALFYFLYRNKLPCNYEFNVFIR